MKQRVKSFSLALLAGLPLMGLSLAGTSHAADEAVFTAKQRAAIVQIVREALKNDPSILSDAIRSIQQQASSQQEAHVKAAVRANWQALSTAPSYAVPAGAGHGRGISGPALHLLPPHGPGGGPVPCQTPGCPAGGEGHSRSG
ncbi:hypothetical protein [Bombella apis]|uniref:hypothetical protein n=1 Tax=Bombella apis TaxID=1785988 RepID=UPI0023F65856|nr:hypothetical protein [Bombella apis]MCT6813988.1 hypothetical protein [Bombella apis]